MPIKKSLIIFNFLLIVAQGCYGESFEEAKTIWLKTKDRPEYNSYMMGFEQYNNHYKLDSKDGCHDVGKGKVNILLVITERASIESAPSDVDSEKSRCFQRAYIGVPVKKPPFSPYVINLNFGE